MGTVLITGVGGQDGSYLAELLVSEGHRVIGTTRDARRLAGLPYASALRGVELVETALDARSGVDQLLAGFTPDELYHLAGPSRVGASWQDPSGTMHGIVDPARLVLEAVVGFRKAPRCFFAGSCEVFAAQERAQNEHAPRAAVSPYGRAKLEAETMVKRYRDTHGLFAVTGILFNHESPRRDLSFVSRKIARAAARIARGLEQNLTLGTLDVRRDWGFAGDHVRAMRLMLLQPDPEDLVVGTGVAHSVRDFCDSAFGHVRLNVEDHLSVDPALVRPGDAPVRLADPSRARARLGWTPEVDFERLVAMMVDAEMAQ